MLQLQRKLHRLTALSCSVLRGRRRRQPTNQLRQQLHASLPHRGRCPDGHQPVRQVCCLTLLCLFPLPVSRLPDPPACSLACFPTRLLAMPAHRFACRIILAGDRTHRGPFGIYRPNVTILSEPGNAARAQVVCSGGGADQPCIFLGDGLFDGAAHVSPTRPSRMQRPQQQQGLSSGT